MNPTYVSGRPQSAASKVFSNRLKVSQEKSFEDEEIEKSQIISKNDDVMNNIEQSMKRPSPLGGFSKERLEQK